MNCFVNKFVYFYTWNKWVKFMMNDVEKAKALLQMDVFKKSVLADKIEAISKEKNRKFISRPAMMNKVADSHRDNFSKDQVQDILQYFRKLYDEIGQYIK